MGRRVRPNAILTVTILRFFWHYAAGVWYAGRAFTIYNYHTKLTMCMEHLSSVPAELPGHSKSPWIFIYHSNNSVRDLLPYNNTAKEALLSIHEHM